MLRNNIAHCVYHRRMLSPFFLQGFENVPFGFRRDNMHLDRILLEKAKTAVNALDELVEFVPYPQEDHFVAMLLEVRAATSYGRLR